MEKFIKCFMLLATMVAFVSSCGGSDNDGDSVVPEQEKTYSIVGSWEYGKYFITFSSSGYYTTYLGDNFIDSGTYTYSGNKVVCKNTYFNRTTTYTISSISEKSLALSATVHTITSTYSTDQSYFSDISKNMTFQKVSTAPTEKDNPLVGKYMTVNYASFGTVKWSFLSHCTGIKTAAKGAAAKYALSLYYIYYKGVLYEQYFCTNNGEAIPSIGGWTVDANDGTIKAFTVVCNANNVEYGDIYNLD